MCANVKESSIPQAVWRMKNTVTLDTSLCSSVHIQTEANGGKILSRFYVCMFYLEQTGVTDMGML